MASKGRNQKRDKVDKKQKKNGQPHLKIKTSRRELLPRGKKEMEAKKAPNNGGTNNVKRERGKKKREAVLV